MKPSGADILYVITDLEIGGVPLHLCRLARAMKDRGFRLMVVSLATGGPVAALLRDEGVEVHGCDGRGGWDFRVIGRLSRIIRRVRPTLVHSLLFHANVAARLAARSIGFPADRVICEIQTVEVERRWHLIVDHWTHEECRLTIGNSPSVVEHLAAKAGIPRDRLRLVKGGIDPEPIRLAAAASRAGLGLDSQAGMILWVGRVDPVKGLDTLIDALPLLGRDRPTHLVLAGDGPDRDRLMSRVERLGFTARVHWIGVRDDVASLLKAADVFAFPSRTEGLPNALLEAMAAARPIVTTDVPGCRDLISHEQTGLIVPCGDAYRLAAAIRRLLDDPELACRLGRRASQAVDEKWHAQRMWDDYAAVYAEVQEGL